MSLHPHERPAALALFPYFSKHAVVIDIGSNIGDWFSILANNVGEAWLFEPNTILRHYSQVRFRNLKNFHYCEEAVSDKHETAEFIYFEDNHDGLSNIIGNNRWDYLNPKRMQVKCLPLWAIAGNETFADFVKIDVEGAELKVLKGAEPILKRKNIKFIQIEHADHIEVTGYKFQDIIDYVRQFGYDVFHYDGEQFVKYSNQEAENLYIMDAEFTQDWNSEFRKNTKGLKFDFALEIGCFEGMTSRYICDNLLNPGGRMIAVDPLTDEYLPGHEDNALFVGQYDRFIRNTRTYPIELIRKKSSEVYEQLKDYRFDFIYVDGDHTADAVYRDSVLAITLCKRMGHILFDDYNGYRDETKSGIDRFLEQYKGMYEVIHSGYQLMIKKLVH